jgi:ATP-binding cassette subfamily F protein 3
LLFEDVTMQVHRRQRLGLIGANGSGKSSLFAMLLGQLEADEGDLAMDRGSLIAHVAQESPTAESSALDFVLDGDNELRVIQRAISQAESSELGPDTVHGLYERLEQIDGFSAESRAARLLHGLGFSDADAASPVQSFSGGWKMRLNLAQALMCRSDMLLLDEPTNHLDLPAILWLESWLIRYPGILLLISHDRDFLDAVCNRIAHIEHERIRLYNGNYSDFELLRAESLAQQQAMFKRQQKEIRHIQSYVDRFRYKASKARQAQSRLKMLERMTLIAPAHVDSPFRFEFLEPEKQPHHLVQLEGVDAGYDKPVLKSVDLQVAAGDRLGLLGVNGAGKSTLVKALADGSTILSGRRQTSRETRIGYFAQHQLDQHDPRHSPFDHLRVIGPGDREADLRSYLGRFGFNGERIFDPVEPFSGGEKARLVLALMIRQRPNLLLLDEPTNHLDLEMRQALARALTDFSGAIVVISHDRHLLRSVCDDLLVVRNSGVERFAHSLDEYAEWLREQQAAPGSGQTGPGEVPRGRASGKREVRRLEALKRQKLKPFSDRVRQIEKKLSSGRSEQEKIEQKLADESLYIDQERKDELTGLIRQQADIRNRLAQLESDWLEASERLEQAQSAG